jgi:outer membrane receptor protein involved in Fe transport
MKYITRTFVLSTALATSLFAQEKNQEVYELAPIVVTGDLWKSELQSTTASVSVLDEARLNSNGTQHFEDVVNSIPNLTWTGGTSRPRYLQIRGIGENSQFEGETPDSSVRFLIDDFDLTGVGTVGNLFDVQQVEVLRGPQAGAFGANAAGGVVQIVSKAPTPYWTGQAEAGIGNDNLKTAGVAFGGPIIESDPEKLTFRFSINSLNQDGFRKNQFLNKDDTNERDELTSRLKVRWQPNELWSFETGLIYAEANNGYDEFTLNNADVDTYSDEPGRDEQETRGGSLRASYYGFDKVDLTYVGQYTDTDSRYSYDSDWGAGYLGAAGTIFESGYFGFLELKREREVASHEFRLDSREEEDALGFIDRWTLGLFYHELSEDSLIDYKDEFGLGIVESDYETESLAFFTQASHDLSESTRLILGLRYESHKVDFDSLTIDDYAGTLIPGTNKVSNKDNLWGGKLTLEQDLGEAHMFFASITRGYKAGGANSGAFIVPGDPLTYDTETLWNYEIGLRSTWFDNKFDSQITVFYLDRDDAQLRDSAGSGGFFRYFASNAGDAEHYGLETQITWYLAQNWTASASLGLLETELESSGRDLSNTPSYNYSARLDYRPAEGFFAGIEIVGTDEYYESNSHPEKRNAYAVVNGSIGYRFENWTFSLWSKNIFDEEYEDRVFSFDNFDPDGLGTQRYEAPAAPRTFGVMANYKW